VLVTGGSSGIGRATAVGLATLGAHVAITGRDATRTAAAAAAIKTATGETVHTFVADLTCQTEVRRLAGEVLQSLPRLDVLVNNVGGYWATRHVTPDGLERTFALNHLAPFLLTTLLLDRLQQSGQSRVVTVSSAAQSAGRLDFEDLQGERDYSGSRAYSQSKLANLLFTRELAKRLAGTSVTANAVHPGLVNTGFGAEDPSRFQRLLVPLLRPVMKSPAQGAARSIRAASDPGLAGASGQFFRARGSAMPTSKHHDESIATRLWAVSASLVGPSLP
jgi:NAD(P)-dependent dehydrogenase (short-subunit alcohol dehydrogenase family)